MSRNGRLTSAELAPVGGGLQLANDTATAWLAMVAAAAKSGIELWIAKPAGAYRDWDMQGNIANKNPDSTIAVASQGLSTHGYGTRVDVGSFGPNFGTAGVRRRAWLLEHAHKFGFTREFGEWDPNHFVHNGRTKPSWLQYRLDWDEMATKAEIAEIVEEGVERVLRKNMVTSEVTGNKVDVLTLFSKIHLNLWKLIKREEEATEPPAPTT